MCSSAGLGVSTLLQKTDTDSLFAFSVSLGSGAFLKAIEKQGLKLIALFLVDYVGQWTSTTTFVITVIDWPGAAPPQVF